MDLLVTMGLLEVVGCSRIAGSAMETFTSDGTLGKRVILLLLLLPVLLYDHPLVVLLL